jgi:uncharacterized membrane protein YdjX (TVP38/TMEM64 family)
MTEIRPVPHEDASRATLGGGRGRRAVRRFLRPLVRKQVVVAGLVLAVLILIATSDALHAGLLALIEAAEPVLAQQAVWGAVAFVLLAALSAMLAFFSTVILVPLAIQVWGFEVTLAMLWTGWTLGGILSFGLGWAFGRPVVSRLATEGAVDRFERLVTHRTPFVHILLFQLTLPSEVPGYVLGTLRYRFWKYLLALGIAEIPYALATTFIGAGLLEQEILIILSASAALALMLAVALLVTRNRVRASRAKHLDRGACRKPCRPVARTRDAVRRIVQ